MAHVFSCCWFLLETQQAHNVRKEDIEKQAGFLVNEEEQRGSRKRSKKEAIVDIN